MTRFDFNMPCSCHIGPGVYCYRHKRTFTMTKHSDDIAVDQFAGAMKAKLDAARRDGRGGWEEPTYIEELQASLIRHVHKGDPRDVANYCMFLWHHKAPTVLEDQFVFDATGKWPTKPNAEPVNAEQSRRYQQTRMNAAGMYGLLCEILGTGAVDDTDLKERITQAVNDFQELRGL